MIVCAAIRVTLPEVQSELFNKLVVPCLRHCDGYSILRALRPDDNLHRDAVEGFIDHTGKFLTREEAFRHALDCGQLPMQLRYMKANKEENMLFSEDLY